MRKLYIIGNGFDKAHGLDTNYWNFREHLQKTHPDFLLRFEELYGFRPLDDTEYGYSEELQKRWNTAVSHELWSKFEEKMAMPDIQSMLSFSESVVGGLDLESGNIGIKDTMDYYWEHEYGFVKELQAYVKEWISQIDLSTITPICQRLINNREDLFFNFNYTGVLEEVYKIPHVLHIHGSILSEWHGDPIIGHCNREEIQKRRSLSHKAEERFDEGDASIQDAIADYLETIYKDTAHLININRSFFQQLCDVDQVVVIGWSAGEVDLPYLRIIRDSVHKKARWTVYYYAKDTADRGAYDSLRIACKKCRIHKKFKLEFKNSKQFWDGADKGK